MTESYASPAGREWSAWMRSQLRRRVEQCRYAVEKPTDIVVTFLAGKRPDGTCNRCGRFVLDNERFLPVEIAPEPWIVVVGALCGDCGDKETVGGSRGDA